MSTKRIADNPFRWVDSSPKVIRLVVMMYVRYPLSLRNVEDLLFERGIDICHETVRLWWNRFGPMFAGEIRRKRVQHMRLFTHWKWRLDEVYVKINGETGVVRAKWGSVGSPPRHPVSQAAVRVHRDNTSDEDHQRDRQGSAQTLTNCFALTVSAREK